MQITYLRLLSILLVLLLAASPPDRSPDSNGKGLTQSGVVGSYFIGNGFEHETLTLENTGKYVSKGFTDAGPAHPIQSGTYRAAKRVLLLQTETGERQLMIIPWGKRLYLIPRERMLHFCNDINAGYEPRGGLHGEYLLRRGDEKKPVVQLPEVPSRWASFLLKKPVTGKVVSIIRADKQVPNRGENGKGQIIVVRVNVGKRQGLKPGMQLRIPVTPQFRKKYASDEEVAVIRKVEANQATAEFVLVVEGMPIVVGATASTHLNSADTKLYQSIRK